MDRNVRYSRQGRTPKSRTSNACEACKRRKTKCSGGPSPCQVCKRADTFCNFNPKLDTRRKLAYNSTTIQDRQQFMLTALLQTIKHSRQDDLQHLISLIRGPSRLDAVATNLRKQFSALQSKGIIPLYDIDDTDVISFGLQGLCGHRKGRSRQKSLSSNTDQESIEVHSPTTKSMDSQDSLQDFGDEKTFDDGDETRSSSPLSIGHEDPFDTVGSYDSTGPLGTVHRDTTQSQGFYALRGVDTLPSSFFAPKEPINRPIQETISFPQQAGGSTGSEPSHSYVAHSSSETTPWSLDNGSEPYMSQQRRPSYQGFCDPSQSYAASGLGSNQQYMMQYYHALANGLPPTLNPSLALKIGHQSMSPNNGPVDNSASMQEDFNHPHYAYPPLRSNA